MIKYSRKTWMILVVLFVAVFSFTFLTQKFKDNGEAQAANPWVFDPGYIISDWQMGNYNSMSEADIQNFLTRINPCDNYDRAQYDTSSRSYPGVTWHWDGGHFVCISQERFGDSYREIGTGETAAHIIWQAAQDFHINPQVLIVLLEKENGLITDRLPHSGQYKTATGFGCPDGAPCEAQYFGFKNQVRLAASLFHEVLEGGWSNYPVGVRYVQYNPNKACGGTNVNIRNRATSALYRYTPYVPNNAALAAGYGTGDGCSSYGNRNFYMYFEDWFGGITAEKPLVGGFSNMVVPRVLYVKENNRYIDPYSGNTYNRTFDSFEYFTHSATKYDGSLCLSIGADRNCYIYNDLEELRVDSENEKMDEPRMLIVDSPTQAINVDSKKFGKSVKAGEKIIFNDKIIVNNQLCLKETSTSDCILYENLRELSVPVINNMTIPRELYIDADKAEVVNVKTGVSRQMDGNKKLFFSKSTYWDDNLCLLSEGLGENECIDYYKYLKEINNEKLIPMDVPRYFIVDKTVNVNDIELSKITRKINSGWSGYFNRRIDLNGKLCLSSDDMASNECIYYDDLIEVPSYTHMDVPRYMTIMSNSYYVNSMWNINDGLVKGQRLLFVDKTYINDELCLRTESDARDNVQKCIKYYSSLREE